MQQYPFTKFNQVFDIITRDVIRNVIMRLNCTRRDRERIYFSKSHDIPESRFPLNRLPPFSQPFPFATLSSPLADCSFFSFANIATILFADPPSPDRRQPPYAPFHSYFCPLFSRAALSPSHRPIPHSRNLSPDR